MLQHTRVCVASVLNYQHAEPIACIRDIPLPFRDGSQGHLYFYDVMMIGAGAVLNLKVQEAPSVAFMCLCIHNMASEIGRRPALDIEGLVYRLGAVIKYSSCPVRARFAQIHPLRRFIFFFPSVLAVKA